MIVTQDTHSRCSGACCAGMNGSVRGAPSVSGAVLSGPEFRERVVRADGSIDRESFRALWPSLRVMGRCSPQDKYTIVRGELSLSMRQPVHMTMWSLIYFQVFVLPSGCMSDGLGLSKLPDDLCTSGGFHSCIWRRG